MTSSFEILRNKFDKHDMFGTLVKFHEDLENALQRYYTKSLPRRISVNGSTIYYDNFNKILFIGMGGSAIGGHIISSYLNDKVSIPLLVSRNFNIPGFVDSRTLVIAVSYSGNTDETLTAVNEIIKRKAPLVVITSNGMLEKRAKELFIPYFLLPRGYLPRTSIGYMLIAILQILNEYEVFSFPLNEVKEAIEKIKEQSYIYLENPLSTSSYKLAHTISNKIPLIYSYPPYTPIGFRFKTQLNENAKMHAFFGELPEVNHNEIMGFEQLNSSNYHVVFIEGTEKSYNMKIRLEFWYKLLKEKEVGYDIVTGMGISRLANMLTLMYQLDFTSYFAALIRGVDPSPVTTISELKQYVKNRTIK